MNPVRRLLMACVLVTAVVALPARASASPDWTLISFTAGPDGASTITAHADVSITATGADAETIGFGSGSRLNGSSILVRPLCGGPARLTTTTGLGSISSDLPIPAGGSACATSGHFDFTMPSLNGGQTAAFVLFGTGLTFTDLTVTDATAAHGALTSVTTSGSGSRAIVLGTPTDGGNAATAGSLAAGQTQIVRTLPEGAVGGFDQSDACAGACQISWGSPDSSGAEVDQVAPVVGQNVSAIGAFYGSAGDWVWAWEGLTTGDIADHGPTGPIVLGAYAPVGDAWHIFG